MNEAETSLDSNVLPTHREQADEVEPQPARNFRFEEALRESEVRYRLLFENHHAIMLVFDPETFDIIDANPAACHYYGYSRAQLTALKITDLNGMTLEQAAREYQRVRQTNVQPYFLKHRLATGEIRDVESYTGPIQLGGKTYQFSIVHDITRRKQVEDELHRERNFVSALVTLDAPEVESWAKERGITVAADELHANPEVQKLALVNDAGRIDESAPRSATGAVGTLSRHEFRERARLADVFRANPEGIAVHSRRAIVAPTRIAGITDEGLVAGQAVLRP